MAQENKVQVVEARRRPRAKPHKGQHVYVSWDMTEAYNLKRKKDLFRSILKK